MSVRIAGTLKRKDGSKATQTKITFESAGMKDCFTDGQGNYSIEISGTVKSAYVHGRKIWSGSFGGGRLDLTIS